MRPDDRTEQDATGEIQTLLRDGRRRPVLAGVLALLGFVVGTTATVGAVRTAANEQSVRLAGALLGSAPVTPFSVLAVQVVLGVLGGLLVAWFVAAAVR